jgi:hypothetical protein
LTRCAQACLRDLERLGPESSEGLSVETLVGQVVGLMAELIQVGRWRHWLLAWNPGVQERRGYTEPATENSSQVPAVHQSRPEAAAAPALLWTAPHLRRAIKPQQDPDHEAAIVSLCRAIEHVLTPWFDGEATLNYAALQHLTSLPGVVPASDSDPHSPAAAIPRALASDGSSDQERSMPAKASSRNRRKTHVPTRRTT